MSITYECECGAELSAADIHAGMYSLCPECARTPRVPGELVAPESPKDASSDTSPAAAEDAPPAPDTPGEETPVRPPPVPQAEGASGIAAVPLADGDAAEEPEPHETTAADAPRAVIIGPDSRPHTRPCPVCKKDVPVHAVRCRHCGAFLDSDRRRMERRGARLSKLAIASLVLGLLSFIPYVNFAAVIASFLALRRINNEPFGLEGTWFARAGLVFGCIGTAVFFLIHMD